MKSSRIDIGLVGFTVADRDMWQRDADALGLARGCGVTLRLLPSQQSVDALLINAQVQNGRVAFRVQEVVTVGRGYACDRGAIRNAIEAIIVGVSLDQIESK